MTPSGPAAPAAMRASGVGVARGGREVVREADLTLGRGEVVALLGPNGAGKSTLLSGLAGIEALSSGRVEVDGRLAMATQAPALARRSARANVEAALAWWGVPRRERRSRALEALERVGGSALAERLATTLSGGEARRVHLARVIAVRPDVLFLDEPFAGLDAEARGDLLYSVSSALRDETRGTLVVVHDRAEAWALADRILVMLEGRLVAGGPPAEVLERPPSPAVARFLGFTGELEADGGVLLTRPAHVSIDPQGDLLGTVVRSTPIEDGLRLEVELARGVLVAQVEPPGPVPGERVRMTVSGGVRFGA